MRKPIELRSWATPLTIGVFILMSATGILMFIGWDQGLNAEAHKWFSLLFLIGAAGHIRANLRPLTNHLRSSWGRISVAAFTIVLGASFFSWGLVTGPQLERPIKRALVEAPLSALAGITRTTPETMLSRLNAQGIRATSQQSVRALSAEYHVDENRLLGFVFLSK